MKNTKYHTVCRNSSNIQ